jgi:hypothetical protein
MKKNLSASFLILAGFVFTTNIFSQTVGDYRSLSSGDWGTAATWQRYDGTSWVEPTGAPGATNNVEIQSGHIVTIPSSGKNCYNLTIDTGAKLWVGNTSVYAMRINGPTAIINGTLGGFSTGDGIILEIYYTAGTCTITGSGVCEPLRIRGGNGKTPISLTIDMDVSLGYQGVALSPLYTSAGIGTLTINPGKTVTLANGSSVATTGSVVNDGSTCTFNIDGNIYAPGSTSYFNLRSSTICTAIINGSVNFGGTLNIPGSAPPAGSTNITINGNLTLGAYAYFTNITVATGGTLDLSNATGDVLGTGTFTLSSGGTLMIGNPSGISAFDAIGNIQSTTRIYSKGANYTYAGTGYFAYTGDGLPDTVNNLLIKNFNIVTLTKKVTVAGTCSINYGSSILEQMGIYVSGITNITRPVGTNYSDFGGIGVGIGSGIDDLGDVTVKRVAGPGSAILGSINRNWTITSTNPPANGRNLTLYWDSADDNGKDLTTAQVWKSTNGGSGWFTVGSPQNALTTHSVTVATNTFSSWTISDNSNPLPVELSTFVFNVQGRNILLSWSTQTEMNSDKFIIERKETDHNWETIGSIKASVSSISPKQYSFTDKNLQSGKYQYRLKMIDYDGSFEYSKVIETEVSIPKNFDLSQNYPNPFNPSTRINYSLPLDSKVTLEIYSITGVIITQLVNEDQSAGYYSVDFNASKLSSGIYFYRITNVDKASGNNYSAIKKMILLK